MNNAATETALAHYQERIRIDRSRLDDELVQQSHTYFEVAQESAFAESRAVAAKDALRVTEAQLARRIRISAETEGRKITESGLMQEILSHPERIEAMTAMADADLEAARWKAMRECWAQRSYALRDLCQMEVSGFLTTSTVRSNTTGDAARAVSERAIAEQRSAIAERRTTSALPARTAPVAAPPSQPRPSAVPPQPRPSSNVPQPLVPSAGQPLRRR